MTTRDPGRSLPCLALALLCGCDAGPAGEAAPMDEAALRAEVLAVEDAMNLAVDGLDCDAGLASIAEAEPIFVSNANVVRTRSQLAAMCGQMVAPRTGAVFSVDSRTAHMLSDDAALVVREGNNEVSFRNGTSSELYMVMSTVWTRDDEGWKMVHLHESFLPAEEEQ